LGGTLKKAKALKFSIIVAVLTLLLQAFLAISPLVKVSAGFWKADSQQDFYNNLTALVALQFLLMTGAVTLILLKASQDQNTAFGEMRSGFPLTIIKGLRESEFYNHFRSAVEDAEHSVKIAYLAPYPPTDVAYEHREKYYKEILELMRRRSDVTFKRLVRASPKNESWVAEMLQELKDRPNVDIALLTRDLPAGSNLPLALSVQVIDDDKSWIVAIGSHEREGEFRDIYVENATLAKGLGEYYSRIWQLSERLLDGGRITPAGQKILEKLGNAK
jgi:hypothetical protein